MLLLKKIKGILETYAETSGISETSITSTALIFIGCQWVCFALSITIKIYIEREILH